MSRIVPILLDRPDYAQAFVEPGFVTHDEELLGELPMEPRAVLRERDIEMFIKWLRVAKPRMSTLYHVGELVVDRCTNPTANLLGHIALKASELGLVALHIKQTGLFIREYTAHRTTARFTDRHGALLHNLMKNPPPPLLETLEKDEKPIRPRGRPVTVGD